MPRDRRTMMGPEPCSSQHPPLLQAFRQRGGQGAEWQHHVVQLAECPLALFLPAPTPASAQESWIQRDAENDRGGDNRRCKLAFEIGQKYTNRPESAASANKNVRMYCSNQLAVGRLSAQPGFNKIMSQEANTGVDTWRNTEVTSNTYKQL